MNGQLTSKPVLQVAKETNGEEITFNFQGMAMWQLVASKLNYIEFRLLLIIFTNTLQVNSVNAIILMSVRRIRLGLIPILYWRKLIHSPLRHSLARMKLCELNILEKSYFQLCRVESGSSPGKANQVVCDEGERKWKKDDGTAKTLLTGAFSIYCTEKREFSPQPYLV